jgi:hypothetical protein
LLIRTLPTAFVCARLCASLLGDHRVDEGDRRDGQRKRLRARRLTACRRYRVSVPKGTRRVHLRWRDGRVVVRRR